MSQSFGRVTKEGKIIADPEGLSALENIVEKVDLAVREAEYTLCVQHRGITRQETMANFCFHFYN